MGPIRNMDSKTLMVGGSCLAFGAAAGVLLSKMCKQPGIQRLNKDGEPWNGDSFACPIVIHDGKVYISGQVGWISREKQEIGETIEEQTVKTLANVDALLKAAGTSKEYIIDTMIWLKDIDQHFDQMNVEFKKWAGDGTTKGVRACVESAMARKSLLVEIKVVAVLP